MTCLWSNHSWCNRSFSLTLANLAVLFWIYALICISLQWFWLDLSRLMTKPTKWLCAQRRLSSALASAQSDQSSLCVQWVAKNTSFPHADSEDSDQTGRMPRLIWGFAGRTCHFAGFVMRRFKSSQNHDINARREADGINIDRGPQQTLNTENPWFNVIITHSKFISSPVICLFWVILNTCMERPWFILTNIPKTLVYFNNYSNIFTVFLIPIQRWHNCIKRWNKRVRHMSVNWQARAFLTGKSWKLQIKVSGSLLHVFYTINCWIEGEKWAVQSGRKHLTGDGLTYWNACACAVLHGWISVKLCLSV